MTFVARPGERNDVAFGLGGSDYFTDAGARLIAGDHCFIDAFGALCEARESVTLDLGDRADRAAVDANSVDAKGGEGDDTMQIGSFSNLVVAGGPGNDTIRIFPNGGGGAHGDRGNDVLVGGEGGFALWGDDGNDTLIQLRGYAEMYGGPGRDLLSPRADEDEQSIAGVLDGDDGDDVIDDRFLHSFLDIVPMSGGAGNDILNGWGVYGMERFSGGPGDDRVHAWNGVACGPGVDVAYVDPVDSVAADCETVRLPAQDALADLAARLATRRPALSNTGARLPDQALAHVQAARRDDCYEAARLRSDAAGAACVTRIVAAVRLLVQVPVLAYELRQLLVIERDLAVTRADDAAGTGATPRRLERAREDIAAADGDLGPAEASRRLRRVWQWLDV